MEHKMAHPIANNERCDMSITQDLAKIGNFIPIAICFKPLKQPPGIL